MQTRNSWLTIKANIYSRYQPLFKLIHLKCKPLLTRLATLQTKEVDGALSWVARGNWPINALGLAAQAVCRYSALDNPSNSIGLQ